MLKSRNLLTAVAAACLLATSSMSPALAEKKNEFNIAWTIYVGWMPWPYAAESGIVKKWADKYRIKINVTQINDYVESINQYTAGKFDGCAMTNMDALTIPAAGGVDSTALIVSGPMGTTDHYALAMQVAAEIFPIRYVCGYSAGAPDGLVPLDNLFDIGKLDPIPAWGEERAGEPGPTGHLAVITWDVGADGLVPVARSHAELIAGGLAVMLESGLQQDCVLLSTLMSSSFAGLATGMIPWLLTGGTLALHHPFDAHTYANQLARTVGASSTLGARTN